MTDRDPNDRDLERNVALDRDIQGQTMMIDIIVTRPSERHSDVMIGGSQYRILNVDLLDASLRTAIPEGQTHPSTAYDGYFSRAFGTDWREQLYAAITRGNDALQQFVLFLDPSILNHDDPRRAELVAQMQAACESLRRNIPDDLVRAQRRIREEAYSYTRAFKDTPFTNTLREQLGLARKTLADTMPPAAWLLRRILKDVRDGVDDGNISAGSGATSTPDERTAFRDAVLAMLPEDHPEYSLYGGPSGLADRIVSYVMGDAFEDPDADDDTLGGRVIKGLADVLRGARVSLDISRFTTESDTSPTTTPQRGFYERTFAGPVGEALQAAHDLSGDAIVIEGPCTFIDRDGSRVTVMAGQTYTVRINPKT